jgi:hypothetical protein
MSDNRNTLTTPYILGIDLLYYRGGCDPKGGSLWLTGEPIQKLSLPPIRLQPKLSLIGNLLGNLLSRDTYGNYHSREPGRSGAV